MPDNGAEQLVNPSGKPLIPEPRFIIVKTPNNVKFDPKFVEEIGKATACNVLILPMSAEILQGKIAAREMEVIHHLIHEMLGEPKEAS